MKYIFLEIEKKLSLGTEIYEFLMPLCTYRYMLHVYEMKVLVYDWV